MKSTTLAELYDEMPDERELLWDRVSVSEYMDQPFRIVKIDPVYLANLRMDNGSTLLETYRASAKPWQKKYVSELRKRIKSDQWLPMPVVDDTFILDGHHRIVAMALEKVRSTEAVDISEPA